MSRKENRAGQAVSVAAASPDDGGGTHISVHRAGGFATVALNRPERGNAFDKRLVDALIDCVNRLSADNEVHTITFRGEGNHFCTGFDLSNAEAQSDGDLLLQFVRVEQLLQAVWSAPVRTAAYAHGRAWGAGADLFAACDVRAAHASATFRFPGVRFGLVLGTRRLARRIGADRARTILLDGEAFEASRAVQDGLASEQVDSDFPVWLSTLKVPVVDRETMSAVRLRTHDGGADEDLAALVRSAARPGLARRIARYREELSMR